MKQSNGGYGPSYNTQISVDSKSGIIIGVAVTQDGTDDNQLVDSIERIKKNMNKIPKQVIADGGYTNRKNIIEMSRKQIDFIGSLKDDTGKCKMLMKRRGVSESFFPDKFEYNEKENVFKCPAGRILNYDSKEKKPGKISYRYRCKKKECDVCSYKSECCPKSKKGRCITRLEEDKIILAFKEKMDTDEAKKTYKQRSQVVEFTNAWIKEKLKLRQFVLQGLEKVNMEILWSSIIYNIQQWIRLKWRKKILLNL